MSKSLIIVESPGKIKKIQSYVGSEYIVCASYGHIMDLDKSNISIDIDNNFKPNYTINHDKKIVVNNLKKLYKSCSTVFLAADEDREGEFIAESIKHILKLTDYKRAVFHEITKKAILHSINNFRLIDDNLVKAQQTRRFLDRIVGYKLSPLLSRIDDIGNDVNKYKLGAGRVQSVIVKIIVEKENEIEEFLKNLSNSYYEGSGLFKIDNINLKTILYNNTPLKKFELIKENDEIYNNVMDIMLLLKNSKWKLFNIKKKNIHKNPSPPFITSSLQRTASTTLHWSIKKTMDVAQKLYEDGLITYMRTDSTIICDEAHNNIKEYINKQFDSKYYNYKQYKSKTANAQEAHEAIRPIDFNIISVDDSDKNKLYKLIWKKTVSSQMAQAIIESTQISIQPDNLNYLMIGSVNKIIFDGYLVLYKDLNDDEEIQIYDSITESSIINPINIKIKELLRSPPSRYNESSLVETLEKLGIGRPSTYAAMISKIQEKDYVRIENINGMEMNLKEILYENDHDQIEEKINKIYLGKENNRMKPTNLGITICNFLILNFPQIMDINFTANLEQDLDEISNGNKEWTVVLQNFYNIINTQIELFLKNSTNIKTINNYINNELIGTYDDYEIIYTKTKFGFAIKLFNKENDIWINVKKKPTLEEAIELYKNKKHNKEQTNIIKTIDKYQIKNGPYGPYIQVKIGKSLKFFKIYNIKPDEITIEDCKKICINKKK
jgi:DNA topoisomerase-1